MTATIEPLRRRALVVDDSRAMRMVVSRIMGRLGFEPSEAEHGQAALDLLGQSPTQGGDSDLLPEVALIDWNMPVMDGLSLVKAIRSEPRYRSITLMMVTTESEQSRIVQALASGAHEYLIKPFTEDALVEKLSLLGLVRVEASVDETVGAVAW